MGKRSSLKKLFLPFFSGVVISFLALAINGFYSPESGAYYFSGMLNALNRYVMASLFFIAAFFLSRFQKYDPVVAGIAMIIIFPVVSLLEAIAYSGSHNLIPFEIIGYLLYALPAIAGFFIGNKIFNGNTRNNGSSN